MADATPVSAYLKIIPRLDKAGMGEVKKELNGPGLEAEATKGGEKIGAGLAAGIAKNAAIVAAAIVAAVGAGVKKSLDAYADYEQLFGGIESVFKGNEQLIAQVEATGVEAWKTLTMSQNEYYESFMAAYPLIKGSIDDENAAIEQTNRLLQLESDLANTFGRDTEYYANAINWALKGTYSYLDNLNLPIKGTAEGFLEAANNSGLFAETITDLDQLTSEDKIAVIEYYADQYGVLGKTAEEAAGTIQGSTKMMGAAWSNLLVTIAQDNGDIEAAVGDLVEAVVAMAGNVLPRVLQIISGIFEAAPALIEQLMPELLSFIGQLVEELPQILEAGMTCLVKLAEGIAAATPELIPTVTNCIVEIARTLTNPANLIPLVQAALQLILAIAQGLVLAIPDLLMAVPEIINQLNQAVLQAVPLMLQAGLQLVAGIAAGIANAAGQIGRALLNACKDAWNQAKSWLGIRSPSKLFADTVGAMIPAGIGEGIEDNENAATDPMQDLVAGLERSASITMQAAAASSTNISNTYNVSMTATDARAMGSWEEFAARAEANRVRVARMG